MSFRTTAAAAGFLTGVVTIGAGIAHADPTPVTSVLRYATKLVNGTVVTKLQGGTFTLSKALRGEVDTDQARVTERDGQFITVDGRTVEAADVVDVVDLQDRDGRTTLTLPLDFHIAGLEIPLEPKLKQDNTILELTPHKPEGVDLTQPVAAKPIASQAENQSAMSEFSGQFGMATGIGSFVGTALGAAVGCVATIAAGCVAGAITGASFGGILGTVALGGPTLVAAGVDLLNTLQAPDGTTRFATKQQPIQPQAQPTQAQQPESK